MNLEARKMSGPKAGRFGVAREVTNLRTRLDPRCARPELPIRVALRGKDLRVVLP